MAKEDIRIMLPSFKSVYAFLPQRETLPRATHPSQSAKVTGMGTLPIVFKEVPGPCVCVQLHLHCVTSWPRDLGGGVPQTCRSVPTFMGVEALGTHFRGVLSPAQGD